MNKFRKPHGGGGGGNGGYGTGRRSAGRPGFGNRDDRPVQKFDAICAECGNECQVPFRPNGTRPVYCSNCFGAQRGESVPSSNRTNFEKRGSSSNFSVPRTDDGGIADLKQQISAMNAKMDSLIAMLQSVLLAPAPSKSPLRPVEPASRPAEGAAKKYFAAKKVFRKKGPAKR